MYGLESAYQRHAKHEKVECKHCKSSAHSSLEHAKHYKDFKEEKKAERMAKHMKMWSREADEAQDKKEGIKQGSKEDLKKDGERGLAWTHKKSFGDESKATQRNEQGKDEHEDVGNLHGKSFSVKHSGKFDGKSNALGHGGRAAQMKAHGVPGGVIGAIARREGAAPGGPNYHGEHKKSAGDQPSMANWRPTAGGFGYPKGSVAKVGDTVNKAQPMFRQGSAGAVRSQVRQGTQLGSTDASHMVSPIRTTAGNNAGGTTAMNPIAMSAHLKHKKDLGVGGLRGNDLKRKKA